MVLKSIRIFIASSAELKEDRDAFRTFIGVENDRLHQQGIYLELIQWEYFLDAISTTSLQSEYNKAIRECDIVLCLFFTKVGRYTAEEFDTAYQVFKDTGKPKIWTYFKDADIKAGSITDDILTLLQFKRKLSEQGHFHSVYTNIDNLKYQFRNQLDKVLPALSSQNNISSGKEEENTRTEKTETTDKYVFNEWLTRRLIEAIQVQSPRAKKFADNASRMAPDWETQSRFSDPAKEVIAFSFVGVVGIQLRKLMAIGKEVLSDNKCRKYLDVCQLTCKRALQLLCFALISRLWDSKKVGTYSLTSEQQVTLQNFFSDELEWDIRGFVNLLATLVTVYKENALQFPIAELNEFAVHLQNRSDFLAACFQLSGIHERLEKSSGTMSDCRNAERHLTTVLETLSFLVNYKMVSIKSIGYFETRNTKPYYLYNYTALGIDVKSNVNQERVSYAEAPITTDAVLLYKGSYQQNINLFPFIIDVNALAFEGGAKICFYACHSDRDKSLNYHFLEDNSRVNVADSGTLKPGVDINELWLDPDKRREMRFDTVFTVFQEAKRSVTGMEEMTDDDFQNPF